MSSVGDRVDARATGPPREVVEGWVRSMRARNLSDQAVATYAEAACQLDAHLATRGIVRNPGQVCRSDIQTFIADFAGMRSAATASVRFRALQRFFTWLLDEEETGRSPMERMKPPVVPERPIDVVAEEDLRRLLRSLDGRDFLSRRDNAAVRLFLDTGLRRTELASIIVPGVDVDTRAVSVLGKGRRPRLVRFGARTMIAMDCYGRIQARQPTADLALLVARNRRRGAMTTQRRARPSATDSEVHWMAPADCSGVVR